VIREQQMSLNPDDVLLLHTDGISERFENSEFPQLRYADAMSIARGIVNRFGKNYDDAGCIAVRYLK
jgi:serine phosphatase RsbU (regulator of sigma subunit)